MIRSAPGSTPHEVRIPMEAGQFAMVRLDQRGVDLEMALSDPDGQDLLFRDATQTDEEALAWIAEKTGTYRLHIAAYEPGQVGTYRLALTGPRQPQAADEACSRASSAYARAMDGTKSDDEKAMAATEAAFKSAREAWAQAGETLQEGIVCWEEGRWWKRRGELEKCLDCYLAAETRIGQAGSAPLHARMLHNAGSTLNLLFRIEEALQYFDRALAIRKAPDLDRASTLQAKSMAYRLAGAFQQARALLNEAGTIQTKIGDAASQARYHNTLGFLFLLDEKPGAALPQFEKAIALSADDSDIDFRLGVTDRLAQTLAKLGRFETAKQAHFRAIERMPSDYPRTAELRYNLGVTLLIAGEFEPARAQLSAAASVFEKQRSTDQWLYALFNLAKCEQALGRCDDAKALTIQALGLMDQARLSTRNLALERTFTALRYAPLELLTDLTMGPEACGDNDAAGLLPLLDRFRSATLAAAMHAQPAPDQAQDPVSAELNQLGDALNRMALAQGLSGRSDKDEDPRRNLIRVRYDQLMASIRRETAPDKGASDNAGDPLPFADDPETAVLYYAMGQDRLYLILHHRGQTSSFDLGPRKAITADVLDFAQLTRDREPRLHRAPIETLGKRLSILLPPTILDQTTIRRLIIVPDDALHQLAFAALPLPDSGSPLVSRFEIAYLPSLASLAALRQRSRPKGDRIAVFAAPRIDDTAVPALPFAKAEADMIRLLQPKADLFLGAEANIATAMGKNLHECKLVHFATHGLLNADRGELSALVLAGSDQTQPAPAAFLRAWAIAGLDLNAELVVLSACQTGLGKRVRGEGLVGLSQAFLQAGAASVLASLWRIDDEATLVLMRAFYRHLFEGKHTVGRALQLAQAEMAAGKTWRDPYFWAGFRLIGDSQRRLN